MMDFEHRLISPEPSGDIILSLIVPTFNRSSCLSDLLDSVIAQTALAHCELLIVDDRSTDDTWLQLQKRAWPSCLAVQLIRLERNSGPCIARNIALAHARGSHVLPIDSDFLLCPGALTEARRQIAENGSQYAAFLFPAVNYHTGDVMADASGATSISWQDLLFERCKGEFTFVVNVSELRKCQLQYPPFRSGGELLPWVALLQRVPALYINHPLIYYRTDSPGRICTAAHQEKHALEVAALSDDIVALFPRQLDHIGRRALRRRLAAAGVYYCLGGKYKTGRQRFRRAVMLGHVYSLPLLLSATITPGLFPPLFRVWRSCH